MECPFLKPYVTFFSVLQQRKGEHLYLAVVTVEKRNFGMFGVILLGPGVGEMIYVFCTILFVYVFLDARFDTFH